ncbi:phosphatidylglycerophosphatase [Roseibium aggregatum]|uniref:Phosphatidylglycerophosphatase n=1 Tax=Roseibium aggregatum TaxID=187304 RepID=A0A926S616_9HYPH|nr:phosphatidylglycerophosphatase [Roseibium aggregatum]MBD1545992.1 phosphatidylglycerophosphatase [Roseibium aggregatum]
MLTLSDTWMDLFGLSGLLNPTALIIGGALGWYADGAKKLWIAAFAAAALSLMVEATLGLTGMPVWSQHSAGPLALFPFRFVGGGIASAVVYLIAKRAKKA